MDDHFDTSGVFEISKFDISKLACIWLENLCPWPISIVCSDDCYWLLVCSGVLVCSGISMNCLADTGSGVPGQENLGSDA